jgi:hypothetical protein
MPLMPRTCPRPQRLCCAYFITEDARIPRKRAELAAVLPPSLQIVTLEEFLEVNDGYVGGKYL